MAIETIRHFNLRVRQVKERREKKNKETFKIDGVNGTIWLKIDLCNNLLGLGGFNIHRIIYLECCRSQEETEKAQRIKEDLMQRMGKTEEQLIAWKWQGISLHDFECLLFFFENKTTLALSQMRIKLGRERFFKSLFRKLIPSEIFDLPSFLDFPEPVMYLKPVENTAISPIKKTHRAKLLKRYRPQYDATPNQRKEYALSLRLQAELGGFREVSTPSGNIDLLTADNLIELKAGERWTHGIGQLIAYGFHHPDKQKVLYLFDYDNLDLHNVCAVCQSANIEVMLEP
jgi:hypothetical protein